MASDTYDQNGNMAAIPRPGTAIPSWANLTADQWATLTADEWAKMEVAPTFRATYDAWNGLVRLTEPEASAPGVPVQDNSHDARGYRIITNTYTAGTLTETRHAYFTDQWQCLEERLGTSTTPDRQFSWGVRYIDDLILRDHSVSGGTLNERLYALQDANWNVTTVTDSTGTIQERYEYEPYGVTTVLAPDFTVRTTSNFTWETTYCSYRWDASSGLFAVRNRFYHPRLGGWLSGDPRAYEVGLNLYDYNYCLIATDPFGEFPWLAAILVLVIAVAIAKIIHDQFPKRPAGAPMTPQQKAQLQAMIGRLIQCAQQKGLNTLASNLRAMRLGRTMTEAGAADIRANANTQGKTTDFAPSFFTFSPCRQYQTLIHEASRVGGNYVEENQWEALENLSRAEDEMFKKLAKCLDCCDEFPKLSQPEDCKEETACKDSPPSTNGPSNVCQSTTPTQPTTTPTAPPAQTGRV